MHLLYLLFGVGLLAGPQVAGLKMGTLKHVCIVLLCFRCCCLVLKVLLVVGGTSRFQCKFFNFRKSCIKGSGRSGRDSITTSLARSG